MIPVPVIVTKIINTNSRTPIPQIGSIGVMDGYRGESMEFIGVKFTTEFMDFDGKTVWMPDDERPIVIHFMPDEIEIITNII